MHHVIKHLLFGLSLAVLSMQPLSAHESAEHQSHDANSGHRYHGAHVHGMATVDMVLEEEYLMIHFKSPLMNFLGFERAPTDAQEQAAFDVMMEQLQQSSTLLETVGTDCQLEDVEIKSPFDEQTPTEHLDMDVSYFYSCDAPEKLQQLAINLFEVFPGIEIIQLQAVLPSGQQQLELTPENYRITIR